MILIPLDRKWLIVLHPFQLSLYAANWQKPQNAEIQKSKICFFHRLMAQNKPTQTKFGMQV